MKYTINKTNMIDKKPDWFAIHIEKPITNANKVCEL